LEPLLGPGVAGRGVLLRLRRVERPAVVVHRLELEEERVEGLDLVPDGVPVGARHVLVGRQADHLREEELHALHLVGARPRPADVLTRQLVCRLLLEKKKKLSRTTGAPVLSTRSYLSHKSTRCRCARRPSRLLTPTNFSRD